MKAKNHSNKFEKGSMDEFLIEAVTLKKLKKIKIGHNGRNPGAGWFLEKIIVIEEKNERSKVEFPCNRWLAVDEDDGEIVRELFPGSQSLLNSKKKFKFDSFFSFFSF